MRTVALVTLGSRGDVQPFVALGRGLQRAGYRVVVATQEAFRAFVEGYGLTFYPLTRDIRPLMRVFAHRGLMDGRQNAVLFVRYMYRSAQQLYRDVGLRLRNLMEQADALVLASAFAAVHVVARRLGKPHVVAAFQPLTPSRDYPPFFLPQASPPYLPYLPYLNLWEHWLFYELLWQIGRPLVNRALTDFFALPPLPAVGTVRRWFEDPGLPFLYAISPSLFPRPKDWPAWHIMTGFWLLLEQAQEPLPADLEAFLDDGPPPVYIGFGSMTPRAPHRIAAAVLHAAEDLGLRVVLARGWGGLEPKHLPRWAFLLDEVPHLALFPRVQAVVHHAGAGTVAAALWAGVPQVAVPHFADQPLWAERLYRLGVAPRPIPASDLDADSLAQALRVALSEPVRRRAQWLARQLREEPGVTGAVDLLRAYLG